MPTPHFGTRFFVILLDKMLKEYLRHAVNIDEDIDPTVKAALTVLIDALPTLLALNQPGPQ